MIPPRDIQSAEQKVLIDIAQLLGTVRDLSSAATSLEDGASRVRHIRSTVYENLNQIQHEYLIVRALGWLRANGFDDSSLNWSWNPRQTGDSAEPDLRASSDSGIVVSAEATTSENPMGVIDSRMRDTLTKLSGMPGKKYYFVLTPAMAARAETKVARNGWQITVVQIDAGTAGGLTSK